MANKLHYKIYISIIGVSFLFTSIFGNNKIVYLISLPRSLSTAFLRMMQERGDFTIFNEPSQSSFVARFNPELITNLYIEYVDQSFGIVKQKVLDAAIHSNVFVKEMSFAIKDFISNDDALMQNPNIYFIFLVRNPHHAIISFYTKQNSTAVFSVNYNLFSHLMSYRMLYDLIQVTKLKSIHEPLIIQAEDLYSRPRETVQLLCDHLGIDFKEDSLLWSDLGSDFTGYDEWHENKLQDRTQLWHGEAIRSTGFMKPSCYEIDQTGNPTFSEITNPDHRKICRDVYEENLDYYALLVEDALKV